MYDHAHTRTYVWTDICSVYGYMHVYTSYCILDTYVYVATIYHRTSSSMSLGFQIRISRMVAWNISPAPSQSAEVIRGVWTLRTQTRAHVVHVCVC